MPVAAGAEPALSWEPGDLHLDTGLTHTGGGDLGHDCSPPELSASQEIRTLQEAGARLCVKPGALMWNVCVLTARLNIHLLLFSFIPK